MKYNLDSNSSREINISVHSFKFSIFNAYEDREGNFCLEFDLVCRLSRIPFKFLWKLDSNTSGWEQFGEPVEARFHISSVNSESTPSGFLSHFRVRAELDRQHLKQFYTCIFLQARYGERSHDLFRFSRASSVGNHQLPSQQTNNHTPASGSSEHGYSAQQNTPARGQSSNHPSNQSTRSDGNIGSSHSNTNQPLPQGQSGKNSAQGNLTSNNTHSDFQRVHEGRLTECLEAVKDISDKLSTLEYSLESSVEKQNAQQKNESEKIQQVIEGLKGLISTFGSDLEKRFDSLQEQIDDHSSVLKSLHLHQKAKQFPTDLTPEEVRKLCQPLVTVYENSTLRSMTEGNKAQSSVSDDIRGKTDELLMILRYDSEVVHNLVVKELQKRNLYDSNESKSISLLVDPAGEWERYKDTFLKDCFNSPADFESRPTTILDARREPNRSLTSFWSDFVLHLESFIQEKLWKQRKEHESAPEMDQYDYFDAVINFCDGLDHSIRESELHEEEISYVHKFIEQYVQLWGLEEIKIEPDTEYDAHFHEQAGLDDTRRPGEAGKLRLMQRGFRLLNDRETMIRKANVAILR